MTSEAETGAHGHDPDQLFAGAVGGGRVPQALELRIVDHVASAGRDQALRVERHVAAAHAVGIDVQLVRRLVGGEADVAVRTRDAARRSEFGLEVRQQGDQRRFDLFVVLAPVRVEPRLVVVGAQAQEETLEVPSPASERPGHAGQIMRSP